MLILRPPALRKILMLACYCVGFGLFMLGIRVPFVFLLVALGVAWKNARQFIGSSWSHGTARLADLGDLIRNRLLENDGLILGTTALMPRPTLKEGLTALFSSTSAEWACHQFLSALGGPKWVTDRMIRIKDFTHLATFAPTGRGKGVSVLVPNLLSYRHSCFVTDPKGELYNLTSEHRRRRFGHHIIRLDPFGVCGPGSDSLNPLHCIDDAADDFLDQCRDLADMLILRSGKETDPYWNESARGVLTAFIAFVCACEDNPENRNLDTVRDLLSSRDSYAKAIEIMQMVESHGGVIRRLGHMMTWHVDRELGSVLSNVQRHTETLDSPVVMRHLVASTFNPMWLRTHRATIYLILPHDKLETLAPLMRLWIGVILRYITRGQPSEDNPVVFFLDEAAHLGKIQVLENAVTLMRGMGIRLWFFFQSLHQLNDCFGEKAKTILDNIDTQQYFAVNEFENADALSKRIGDATISVASYGENRGESHQRGESGQHSGSVSTGSNTNFSDIARRVLKPEELLTLPEDVALVFHRNMPVIPVRLLRYYSHPVFKNGGTGVQPGLGRIATEKSVCLLLAGLLFVAFTLMAIHNDSGPERQIHFLPIEGRSEPDGDDPLSGGQRSYPPAFVGRRYPR